MTALPELTEFAGRWLVSRHIEDRRAGMSGRFDGRACFARAVADPQGFEYFETGEMRYADQPAMAASRAYLWQPHAEGIEVRFGDGRPFHIIRKGGVMPDAVHFCDPDMYHVSYDFSGFGARWQAVWRVQGPSKDYRMVSEYRWAEGVVEASSEAGAETGRPFGEDICRSNEAVSL